MVSNSINFTMKNGNLIGSKKTWQHIEKKFDIDIMNKLKERGLR